MNPICERAFEYAREIWAGGKRPYASAKKMSLQDFTAGAEWMREELTHWRVVKEELPEERVSVLTKTEYDGQVIYEVDFVLDGKFMKKPTPTKWRPINE